MCWWRLARLRSVGLETQERVDIVVWNPEYEGQASRLKTEAEVDAAVLRQNFFFPRKPQFCSSSLQPNREGDKEPLHYGG